MSWNTAPAEAIHCTHRVVRWGRNVLTLGNSRQNGEKLERVIPGEGDKTLVDQHEPAYDAGKAMVRKRDQRTQRLNIRLLKAGVESADAVRSGTTLEQFSSLPDSFIVRGANHSGAPKWVEFLELSTEQSDGLRNVSAYALILLKVEGRWFAISFGSGFQKLEPSSVEHDFGLRVVINAVDENKLRSADVQTPDENSTTTRTQASHQSSQEIFEIDHERDLVRGLAGTPRDDTFASRVSGSDALTLSRKTGVSDLPTICREVFGMYNRTEYTKNFAWIDDIRHERDPAILESLEAALLEAMNSALVGDRPEELHLAWPVIYDPNIAGFVRYTGFRSQQVFDDLDIRNYFDELRGKGVASLTVDDLSHHRVEQTDDDGVLAGETFTLHDCLVFESDFGEEKYVLSSGRWYRINPSLARQVAEFFDHVPRYTMPGTDDENETDYIKRLKIEKASEWICFDGEKITPTDATSPIEACDFFEMPGKFIHIKNQAVSSKLSHLFNQGLVSARTFKTDGGFRDRVKEKAIELTAGRLGTTMLGSGDEVTASEFTVAYTVLREKPTRGDPVLPFFSLVTFRHVAKALDLMGFKYEFAWVIKEAPSSGKQRVRRKKRT